MTQRDNVDQGGGKRKGSFSLSIVEHGMPDINTNFWNLKKNHGKEENEG